MNYYLICLAISDLVIILLGIVYSTLQTIFDLCIPKKRFSQAWLPLSTKYLQSKLYYSAWKYKTNSNRWSYSTISIWKTYFQKELVKYSIVILWRGGGRGLCSSCSLYYGCVCCGLPRLVLWVILMICCGVLSLYMDSCEYASVYVVLQLFWTWWL